MRVLFAIAAVALLAGPAYAQKPVPRYGDTDKTKTSQELAAEKETEEAYKRSLRNIPAQAPTDPWGNVRSDRAPKSGEKSAAKAAPAKLPKATDGAVK